jgi:hypothetical protein
MRTVTVTTATGTLKHARKPDDNEAVPEPGSDRDDAPIASTSSKENGDWLVPNVWRLIGQRPGGTTDELIADAIAGHEDDPKAQLTTRFVAAQVALYDDDGGIVERDGGWYRTHELVLKALNRSRKTLTPQEIQQRAGLTQRQTVSGLDHLEKWWMFYGTFTVDWSGWDVEDPSAALTDILGEGWEESRRLDHIASPLGCP